MFSKFRIICASLSFLIFFSYVSSASAAALSFGGPGSFSLGQVFSVPVLVTSAQQSINAISASVSFPSDKLELISLGKQNSIINFWTQEPTFSNSGTASFEGVVLNPGWTGQSGTVISLSFKVKSAGSATLSFSSASVLANDGKGTNVLDSAASKQISLGESAPESRTEQVSTPGAPLAPAIRSSTHPDPAKWYGSGDGVFSWNLPSDVTAIRLKYDDNPVSDPTVLYSPPISKKELKDIPDGVHYLHVQFKNNLGWGAVANFRFQIDTAPPLPFTIRPAHKDDVNDPRPIFFFNTRDKESGIDHYDIKIGEQEFFTVTADQVSSNPYTPPPQEPGRKTVIVNAYDKAGNFATASTEIEIKPINTPLIDSYAHEISEGDLLRIRGRSYPDSSVTISLKDSQGLVLEEVAKTNSLGDFGLIWTRRLSSGVYTFTAQAVDKKGAISLKTEPYTVVVKQATIFRIGALVINYLSLIILALMIFAFLAAIIMYAFHKLAMFKKNLRRTLHDTEKTVHRDFDVIKDEIVNQLGMLERAKTKRSLTKEEKIIAETFRKHLILAEEDITEKLDKVKREVE